MNRRSLTVLVSAAAGIAALAFAVAPARALPSPQTSTITVTASVAKSCTMTNTSLNFGAYDPASGTADDQTATFTLNCTKGTTGTVSLNNGVNGARNMKGSGPNQTLTVYGRIATGLYVTPDTNYSDTVTASVTF